MSFSVSSIPGTSVSMRPLLMGTALGVGGTKLFQKIHNPTPPQKDVIIISNNKSKSKGDKSSSEPE